MKIIHLISGYFGQGGAERLVADLADAQGQLDNEVTICTFRDLNDKSLSIPQGIRHHSLGKKKGLSLTLAFSLKAYLKSEKPDVVNCHLPAIFPYLIPSLLECKNIRFFYTIHSNPIQEEPRAYIRALRKFFINIGRLEFIAISETIKRCFEDLYGVSKIKMIYNGRWKIDKSSNFESVRKEVDTLKKDNDTKVFIAVGRLTVEKNHTLMIEAFSKLSSENIILMILGQGDKSQFDRIISDNVFLLGSKNNVHDYLYCADAFCMSSTYEGFPISIIEAMSIGLPILSTKVGGIPDVVIDGKNGLLCDTLEPKDYVQMIQKYLSLQEDSLKEMSKNNRRAFMEKYDIAITAEHYISAYNQ